jgi:flagellar biosynthetic protein FliR
VIVAWIVTYGLILARVGAFVSMFPLFGTALPRMVKIGLALALSIVWFDPSAVPSEELLRRASDVSWLALGMALGREAIIGALLGYVFGLFLVPARVAGEFISQGMGLTLGNIINPTGETSSSVVSQIFEMLATLIFFGLDGHHVFLAVLHSTFARWPIGGPGVPLPVMHVVTGAASAEEWGLLLAAPVGLCLFLTSVVLALMARVAPQMNIFSVGYTLQVGIGLAGAIFLMSDLTAGLINVFERLADLVLRLG